jgi:hypothetical protein
MASMQLRDAMVAQRQEGKAGQMQSIWTYASCLFALCTKALTNVCMSGAGGPLTAAKSQAQRRVDGELAFLQASELAFAHLKEPC